MTPEDISTLEALIRRVIREELAASKRKRKADEFVGAPELEAAGVNARHAAEWLAIRKAKTLPLTLTAWEQTQEEAKKAGIPVGEAIRISCGMSWAGFRAAWMDKVAPEVKPLAKSTAREWIERHESVPVSKPPAEILALVGRIGRNRDEQNAA